MAGWDALWARVEAIADQGPFRIRQEDIFFRQAHGRLKLRRFDQGRGEMLRRECHCVCVTLELVS
ncbi:MAG: hypothetical protein ACK53L_26140, partial [Pirellulaceae bacterium]